MKKISIGLVLSVASSFVLAATEIRIHEQRSSEAGFPAFYTELMQQGVVADDDTVAVRDLLRDVCWRAEVRQHCIEKNNVLLPSDQLVAGFQSRNGFKDRVGLVEYRLQAHAGGKGVFLPLSGVVAMTTPVASPATTTAAAPVPAPVATAPALTAEEVAKAAQAAGQQAARVELKGFDKATQALNAQVEQLKKQLVEERRNGRNADATQQAALSKAQAKLDEQLAAAATARDKLQQQFQTKLDTQVASLPEMAASAAAAKIEPLKASVAGMVTQVQGVNLRVSTVEEAWFVKYQTEIAGGLAAVLGLLGLGGVINWRRTAKNAAAVKLTNTRVDAVDQEVDHLKGEVEVLGATIGQREVIFPDLFGDMIELLGRTNTEPAHIAKLQVQGVPSPVMITVTHAEPGYVYVSGVPGHDSTDKVRVHKLKDSKKYNGVQLLVFKVANRGGFDHLKLLQTAA